MEFPELNLVMSRLCLVQSLVCRRFSDLLYIALCTERIREVAEPNPTSSDFRSSVFALYHTFSEGRHIYVMNCKGKEPFSQNVHPTDQKMDWCSELRHRSECHSCPDWGWTGMMTNELDWG